MICLDPRSCRRQRRSVRPPEVAHLREVGREREQAAGRGQRIHPDPGFVRDHDDSDRQRRLTSLGYWNESAHLLNFELNCEIYFCTFNLVSRLFSIAHVSLATFCTNFCCLNYLIYVFN